MARAISHQTLFVAFLALFRALHVRRRFSAEQRETLVMALPQPFAHGAAPMDLQIAWNMVGRALDLPLGEADIRNELATTKKTPLRPTNRDFIVALMALFRVIKATRRFRREKIEVLQRQLLEPLGPKSHGMALPDAWEAIRRGHIQHSWKLFKLLLKLLEKKYPPREKVEQA